MIQPFLFNCMKWVAKANAGKKSSTETMIFVKININISTCLNLRGAVTTNKNYENHFKNNVAYLLFLIDRNCTFTNDRTGASLRNKKNGCVSG